MTITTSMESYAARLASFSASHSVSKKRSSDAKGAKTVQWPHKNPTAPQLARAGFFYRPTSSCPDNTTCYLCQRSLDGWEPEDDAIEEHLKHSPGCGWAITISVEQDIERGHQHLEDPISERMLEARKKTFGTHWPHENKRGWVCKIQKMIYAGWYYCPTLGSDDFVKCAYCNLSLDGWEPKDNPHDEHHRRSPECLFFTISTAKSRTVRTRKGRTSTASRLSTQPDVAAASEELSLIELANQNESLVSTTESVKPDNIARGSKKAPKAKRGTARAKGKTGNAKPADSHIASSFLEAEDDNFEVKVVSPSAPTKTSKKRKSEEISVVIEDAPQSQLDLGGEDSQPPKRRRGTRTRSSVIPIQEIPVPNSDEKTETDERSAPNEEIPSEPYGKTKGKGNKKRASSASRKASGGSTASKAPLRSGMPDDEQIDAALEAELNKPLTDEETDPEPVEVEKSKGRRLTRTKPGTRKAAASVAPTRRGTRSRTTAMDDSLLAEPSSIVPIPNDENKVVRQSVSSETAERPLPTAEAPEHQRESSASLQPETNEISASPPPEEMEVVDETMDRDIAPKAAQQKRKTRKATRTMSTADTQASHNVDDATDTTSNVNNSVLQVQTAQDDPEHETDANTPRQSWVEQHGKEISNESKRVTTENRVSTSELDVVIPLHTTNEGGQSDWHQVQPEAVITDLRDEASSKQGTIKLKIAKKPSKTNKRVGKATGAKKIKPKLKTPEQEDSSDLPINESNARNPIREAPPSPPAGEDEPEIRMRKTPSTETTSITDAKETSAPMQQPSDGPTPKSTPSPQSSDAENRPPSGRPSDVRPPLLMQSPSKPTTTLIPLALSTPVTSPSKANIPKLQSTLPWTAVDLERIFRSTPSVDKENNSFMSGDATGEIPGPLTSPEKRLTVEQWIQFNAQRAEEKLRTECERRVNCFEGEGVRALKTLEGIVCSE